MKFYHFQVNQPQQQQPEAPQQRSGWRSWGAVNILSNASKHVASITTQVSQSIYDTMNQASTPTDESGEGATESKIPPSSSGFRLDGILSESTKMVRDIGKKTIHLIQDSEPISNMTSSNLPNLSQMLKEAKEKNDEVPEGGSSESRFENIKFEQLLDDFQGCMSLEALQILSNQSQMKIELMLKSFHNDKNATADLEETLDEVKELCDFDCEVDFDSVEESNLSKLFEDVDKLDTKIDFTETIEKTKEVKNLVTDLREQKPQVVSENAKKVLAKMCSLCLHNLHKFAESLLNKSRRSTATEAESLLQIASIYCSIFNYVAASFTEIIEKNSDENKKAVTNIFLEVSRL